MEGIHLEGLRADASLGKTEETAEAAGFPEGKKGNSEQRGAGRTSGSQRKTLREDQQQAEEGIRKE